MREKRTIQSSIFELYPDHEVGRDLQLYHLGEYSRVEQSFDDQNRLKNKLFLT